MKKINIKIKDQDKLEFELCEKGEIGDYFSLKELNNIDLSLIENTIKNFESDEINKRIKLEKENITKKYDFDLKQRIFEYEKAKAEEINELKSKLQFAEQEKLNSIEKTKLTMEQKEKDLSDKKQKEIFALKEEKLKIEEKYKNQIRDIENSKINEVNKVKNELNASKNKLDASEELFNQRLNIEKDKLKNQYSFTINELTKEKEEYKNKIETIKRESSNNNIKLIGEDLENWIQTEFFNYFGMNKNITIEKANKAINGTKPDFIIKIIDDNENVIDVIVIEAKSELISGGKTKNWMHYEKLAKDSKNNNGTYSLLVSELEKEINYPMHRVREYSNMFVIRPNYLVYFLNMILEVSLKNNEIKLNEINFKNKEKLLKEWEDFKTKLFGSFERIEKQVRSIENEKENIIRSADKIDASVKLIWNTHLIALKNKVEDFKIIKLGNKVEKFNIIEESENIALAQSIEKIGS